MDINNEYLMHYGVLGMRWGVRKNKDTIFARKSSRMTRGLQHRIKKDEERAASGKARRYDTEKMKKDLEWSKNMDKKVQDRVSSMSTGKAIGQALLFGSRGALRYNQARVMGAGRGAAAVAGIFSGKWPEEARAIASTVITESKYDRRGMTYRSGSSSNNSSESRKKKKYDNVMKKIQYT